MDLNQRAYSDQKTMSSGTVAGIQGQPLEVTVVSCSKLKDTEWISRQDPYVCLEYASTKFRTRTCTGSFLLILVLTLTVELIWLVDLILMDPDGGKYPVFQEKFVVPLIEGLRELTVVVWNSNTLKVDDFIGTGKWVYLFYLCCSWLNSLIDCIILLGFNWTRFCLKVLMTLVGHFKLNLADTQAKLNLYCIMRTPN